MNQNIHLRCRCGDVEMAAAGLPIMRTECHCTSCGIAAGMMENLPGALKLREANGGTRMEVYRKDRVRCLKGADRLREFRLTEKAKTCRVVASCCNTPMFLDFINGHWIDLYGPLWPDGALPPPQMRTMVGDRDDRSALSDDVPNLKTHSFRFFLRLIGAWIAMGFRHPHIDYVKGELDVGRR